MALRKGESAGSGRCTRSANSAGVVPTSAGEAETLAHVPVLLDEVLDVFAPLDGKLIVDGTFGAGGYAGAFLEAGARVIGLDRDPGVKPFVRELEERFGDRLSFVNGVFSRLDEIVLSLGDAPVDGVVLDIGVSSMQLDDRERGFSFREDGPLDMRMGPDGESAAQMLARLDERELSDMLFAFGEER
ncbi:MAG TPA: 16S rRNA (cytosine(1402)-N(4))-methyltransferase, partial [Devosia sp.]|nr:16S rRNA (cytosine(1402)-N(4))-methyltransferase [Devosia sp.]